MRIPRSRAFRRHHHQKVSTVTSPCEGPRRVGSSFVATIWACHLPSPHLQLPPGGARRHNHNNEFHRRGTRRRHRNRRRPGRSKALGASRTDPPEPRPGSFAPYPIGPWPQPPNPSAARAAAHFQFTSFGRCSYQPHPRPHVATSSRLCRRPSARPGSTGPGNLAITSTYFIFSK
jgi:hypothetical protein